jgi:hypothetical protein
LTSYPAWRANTAVTQPLGPAFVEFPTQSEVRVNGQLLNVNLKGIKKKEGSTMPPDLSKPPASMNVPALNLTASYTNRAELIYTNSTEKRFYVTACLVLYIPPTKGVEIIQAKPKKSREDAIKKSAFALVSLALKLTFHSFGNERRPGYQGRILLAQPQMPCRTSF